MNAQDEIGMCPSEFGLERLRAGELDGLESGRATALHVERCAVCTSRMAAISLVPPPFPMDGVWRAARGQAQSKDVRASSRVDRGVVRGRVLRRGALAFLAGTAVAAAAVLLLRAAPPADLVKGGPWGLTVIAKPRGRQEVGRISSGAHLSPGDRLRFEVSTTWTLGYAAIISLDSAGVVSSLVPSAGQALEVRGGRRVLFDGAVELDQAAGPERIELFGCPRPMSVAKLAADARAVLEREGGDPRKVGQIASGCHQETFWIEKTTP